MCSCPQQNETFYMSPMAKENGTTTAVQQAIVVAGALVSAGPQLARQVMKAGGNHTVLDHVMPEMLHRVDPYWIHFAPMDPILCKMICAVMFVLCLIGVFGNGTVVYLFITTPALRSPSNILVLNLAFSDFIMMFSQTPVMVINAWFGTWVVGAFYCDLYAMLGAFSGCTSIWSMVAIAADRYNVIVKGMSGKPLTVPKAIIEVLIIWTFASCWSLAPMFGWNRYMVEGNLISSGTDYFTQDWGSKSYIVLFSIFVYYTPLISIITCYYFIISTVHNHEKAMAAQAKKMNVSSLRSGDASGPSAEAKLAKVALTTISLWFFAWTPYKFLNYWGMFAPNSRLITPIISLTGAVFAKANACYNPIVYAISHPKVRAALDMKCPCLVCGKVEKDEPPAKSDGKAANADAASTHTNDGKA